MKTAAIASALFLGLALGGSASAQTCGSSTTFNVVSCSDTAGTFWCPRNSTCAASRTCTCNSGFTAVTCSGARCSTVSCTAPNWQCADNDGCGSNAAFNIVSCSGGGWCPLNSTCGTSGCTCNSGYTARSCSGTLCSGTCSAPNYWCSPTSTGTGGGGGSGAGGGGGGGTGGFSGGGGSGTGGGGGTGGSGGTGGTCSGTHIPTVDSCGDDICACSAKCSSNSQCNSGCCVSGYCALPCVCSQTGATAELNCTLGQTYSQFIASNPAPRWGCALGGPELLPLLALMLLRRRRTA